MNYGEQKRLYKKAILEHGFLTMVRLLDILTDEEEYEECRYLYDAIQEINKEYNMSIPTVYSPKVVELYEKHLFVSGPVKRVPLEKQASKKALALYTEFLERRRVGKRTIKTNQS